MRMGADGAADILKALRHGANAIEAPDMRTDRQHATNARRNGAFDDRIKFALEIREIEMTMAIDKHDLAFYASAPASGST
jgi:hypothetical protein